MSNGTMRPPRPAAQPGNEALKHVIAAYTHRARREKGAPGGLSRPRVAFRR
ncbi:MAG: hypothetical protein NVS9B8_10120 [Candidatus Limnocylindrales bacterium]